MSFVRREFQLQARGQDIEVMTEDDFLRCLDGKPLDGVGILLGSGVQGQKPPAVGPLARATCVLQAWRFREPVVGEGAHSGRRYDRSLPMIGSIVLAIVVGAIIGLVARLIMPGKQDVGMIMTVALGALGGLIGSWVASYFGYHNANGGIAWIPFFIGVGAAVILIAIWESVMGRRTRRSRLLRR
jgi:uncharacterized membrane protein YeaQ/YmgE (transglycosylase-associated protein family)